MIRDILLGVVVSWLVVVSFLTWRNSASVAAIAADKAQIKQMANDISNIKELMRTAKLVEEADQHDFGLLRDSVDKLWREIMPTEKSRLDGEWPPRK